MLALFKDINVATVATKQMTPKHSKVKTAILLSCDFKEQKSRGQLDWVGSYHFSVAGAALCDLSGMVVSERAVFHGRCLPSDRKSPGKAGLKTQSLV